MPRMLKALLLIFLGSAAVVAAMALMPAQTAEAQCGSQASSCKSCHEVQGQDPVNAKGDWHIQHAFGDFCQFCHAGNVQAMEATAAHAGMVAPLGDIQANCAACHPADSGNLAQTYAAVLGVSVGDGGDAPTTGSGPSGPAPAAPQATPPAAMDLPAAVDLPAPEMSGPGVIDYNQQYAETVEGKVSVNWGNVILAGLIALLVAGGGGFVLWNERRLRGTSGTARADHPGSAPKVAAIEGVSPEISALLPQLERLNPLGRRALGRLLENPDAASDLLLRLSRLDPVLVQQLRGLDRETRELLLAMTGS